MKPVSLQLVSELLVVFLELGTVHVRGTIHVYGTVHVYDTIHVYGTIHVKRGSDPRIFRCKAGNSSVRKATVVLYMSRKVLSQRR